MPGLRVAGTLHPGGRLPQRGGASGPPQGGTQRSPEVYGSEIRPEPLESAKLARVDPARNEAVAEFGIGNYSSNVEVSEDAVWATSEVGIEQ